MVKAFATILNNYCSKVMKHRVEEKSNYKSTVRDNPVELLLRIKQYMYVPTRAKYEHEGLLETLKQFMVGTKQAEDEDLTAYGKRFKQANDIFKQAVGKGWLDNFVQHTHCTYEERARTVGDVHISKEQ